ncbi:MAG TPA: hypothetical protein VGF67_19485 [Ktedonobacteraceae bacterium]|jgi:hypothetical protein
MHLDRLLNAPAWLVRALDDSGCLLVPVDRYDFGPPGPSTYESVARYLGFCGADQEDVVSA